MAEMLSNRPLFQGNSTMNQLEEIITVTGKPSGEDIEAIHSPFALTMLESIPPTRQTSLTEKFPGQSAEALELMHQCLHFNPNKRCAAEDALRFSAQATKQLVDTLKKKRKYSLLQRIDVALEESDVPFPETAGLQRAETL